MNISILEEYFSRVIKKLYVFMSPFFFVKENIHSCIIVLNQTEVT